MDDDNFLMGHIKKFMKHAETMPEKPEHHAELRSKDKGSGRNSDANSQDSQRSKSQSGSEQEHRDNEDPNVAANAKQD